MVQDVITIDGPAGSGKSTVARFLAKRIGYLYLDTGALYRAVALAAKRKGLDVTDGPQLGELCTRLDLGFKTDCDPPRILLDGEDISAAIRSPEIDMLSSAVSMVKEVREAMTELQRQIGKEGKAVAEGRDMGTVVFPKARHKFFLTASSQVRAERRFRERLGRGEEVSRNLVVREMGMRDLQDESRSLAPLRPARDARLIDTTRLNAEQVIDEIERWIRSSL
jgi:cytidylate kinase